jgi:hypothetical protein
MGMLNMMMHLILNTNKRLQLKLDMPKLQTIKRKGSRSYVNYSSTSDNSQFDTKCTQFYHKKYGIIANDATKHTLEWQVI